MRFKGGMGLVALLALLVAAPGAAASTVSLRDSWSSTPATRRRTTSS